MSSIEDYLDESGVSFYLEDITEIMLALRHDTPLQCMTEYFESVANGTNVMKREFAYVSGTRRNRLAFLAMFEHMYLLDERDELASALVKDVPISVWHTASHWHALASTICIDFPLEFFTFCIPLALRLSSSPSVAASVSTSSSASSSTVEVFDHRQLWDCVQLWFFYYPLYASIAGIFKTTGRSSLPKADIWQAVSASGFDKLMSPLGRSRLEQLFTDSSLQSTLVDPCKESELFSILHTYLNSDKTFHQSAAYGKLKRSIRNVFREKVLSRGQDKKPMIRKPRPSTAKR